MAVASGEDKLNMTNVLGEMEWYRNCVWRAQLLDPRITYSQMGKSEDPPAKDALSSAKETIYEAFWRTMI